MGIGAALGERQRDGCSPHQRPAETVRTKQSFGAAFRSRRCLVPADGWFEWRRTPVMASSPTSWRSQTDRWRSPRCGSADKGGESLKSFTMITTEASSGLSDIHHQHPAIIAPDQFDDWLDPTSPVLRRLDLVREPYRHPTKGAPSASGPTRPERRPGYSGPRHGKWGRLILRGGNPLDAAFSSADLNGESRIRIKSRPVGNLGQKASTMRNSERHILALINLLYPTGYACRCQERAGCAKSGPVFYCPDVIPAYHYI